MIDVIRAGALTTVQDLGRPGWAHLGVPRSGALDMPALQLANRLVGNRETQAGLEITLTGCTLRMRRAATVAVTGADARIHVAGRPVAAGRPVTVPEDGLVRIGPARTGVRCYLAVAGGIAVEPVLGSRATDTLSGLGPAPLRDGDLLPVGPAGPPPGPGPLSTRDQAIPGYGGSGDISRVRADPAPPPDSLELTLRLGPRDDWFTPDAIETLFARPYTTTVMSNRVGVRLAGAALTRARSGELPSEGIPLGAVQVPTDGQPVIFLADHPTTGGYPVLGVLDDVTPLAQARPGTTVRFRGPQR